MDLGPYRLLLPLGEGGMGEVWAASDTSALTPRIVAVKLSKGTGLQANLHLFDEARLASTIQSVNVCRVLEFGEARGYRFLVLEWCDGASLQELLDASPERRLPETVAARIVAEVASGLHAAHELRDESGRPLGVVHRDVSPQNVLVCRDGRVLVTDFGIAKALDQKREATETGQVKGKTSYLAPEQIRTKEVDRRADVFALGAVLYTAVVGRKPFAGEDALATIYQILEGEFPRPREVRPELSEALEGIILRALALLPEERFPSMQAFREALEGWLRTVGTRVTAAEIRSTLETAVGARINSRNDRVFGALSESEVTQGLESTGTLTIPPSRRESVQARPPKTRRPTKVIVAGLVACVPIVLSTIRLLEPSPRPQPAADVPAASSRAEATDRRAASPGKSETPTPMIPPSEPVFPAPSAQSSAPRPTTSKERRPSKVNATSPPPSASAPRPAGKKPTRPLDTVNPFAIAPPASP